MNTRQRALRPVKGQAGMTLVEVMVASMIFLVGILGVASLQVQAMQANADAFKMTEGAITIGDRIEQVMSARWTDTYTAPELAAGAHTETVGHYTVSWDVTDATHGRSKTVDLTVGWSTAGDAHEISQVVVRTKK